MSNKQNNNKQPSPADLIAKAEADIARLEREREAHVARGIELAERRKAASYAAHVQHDPESRKALNAVNAEVGMHASELQSFDDALATACHKLSQAQRAQAREEERARIIEQRKMNAELRKLGAWLDRSMVDYVGGLRGLAKVPGLGLPHPTNGQQVLMLYRVFLVAIRGTPWEREFGVADSNDQRSFSSHAAILDQWADANERDFKYRLAALDGEQQTNTEAA